MWLSRRAKCESPKMYTGELRKTTAATAKMITAWAAVPSQARAFGVGGDDPGPWPGWSPDDGPE